MKRIELNSVKIPVNLTELIKRTNGENITELNLKITAYEPSIKDINNTVQLNGYLKQLCIKEPILTKDTVRYKVIRQLQVNRINEPLSLTKLNDHISNELKNKGFSNWTISVLYIKMFIDDIIYEFKYHTPARSLVLKSIDNEPIGQLSAKDMEELIYGKDAPLKFTVPSHCIKKYKEYWECK